MVPASLVFCLANQNREASSGGRIGRVTAGRA
jgi:hypothetical protein